MENNWRRVTYQDKKMFQRDDGVRLPSEDLIYDFEKAERNSWEYNIAQVEKRQRELEQEKLDRKAEEDENERLAYEEQEKFHKEHPFLFYAIPIGAFLFIIGFIIIASLQ